MGVSGGSEGLVGRAPEQHRAILSLRAGGGVLVAGPPGVGKSCLARAVAEQYAKEAAAEIVPVRPTGTHPLVPFAPFAPFLAELGPKPGRQADPFRLLQSFRVAVARRARAHPLILLVDDGHLLDGYSAHLVFHLVADGTARLVMALEAGAPAPGPLRALWKDELVERIDVGPLDQPSTAELVAHLLRREADPAAGTVGIGGFEPSGLPQSVGGDVTDAVWQISLGYPLYVRELVKEGCRSGRISLRDRVWRLDDDLEAGPRLSELVGERLRPLTRGEREALDLVATSEPAPLTVLQRLARQGDLEALENAGLVSFHLAAGEQVVSAGHPVIGEVVRRSMPVPRAAGLGRKLADAFDADGRTEADLPRVVTWRLDGGANPAADLLLRASLRAAARQDWHVSARLAEAALSRHSGVEEVLALADAYRALGRFGEAHAVLAVLGDERGEGDDQVARVAVLRASVLYFGFARLREALDVLAEACERIDDPSDRAWLKGMTAGLTGLGGRPDQAVDLAEKLLAEPGLRPMAELTVRAVLSIGLSWTGRTERALEVLDGFDPGPDAGADLPTWGITARMLAYRYNGQLDALERFARSTYQTGVRFHDPRVRGPAAAALGWVALDRARLPRAVSWFREASVALQAAGALAVRAPALLGLAEALAFAGDVDGSRAALDEARPIAEMGPVLMPAWLIAAGWLAAAQGATSEALEHLEEAASIARDEGQTISEIQALHSSVRLGSSAPAARLTELASWVEGSLIQIVAQHAVALQRTERLGDALDAVAKRYADLGLNLVAAEAAAQACRAHGSAGRPRSAAASAAQGHFLLGASDGPPPLGLALALSPPELTRREREVAMLAAGGLPSQAIATRLCLSVRTVETHLARVYVKLGIGGRSELSVALESAKNRGDSVEAV